MEQNRVYVTGHRHPDTDSIAAAIGYAFYKRANGIKAVPCRLGKLSAETKYLLDRFGFEQPMLLEDARFKLGEINLDEPVSIAPDKTLFEAIRVLAKNNRRYAVSSMRREGSWASSREATPRTSRWEIRTARRDSSRILRSSVSAPRSTAGSSTRTRNPERMEKLA